MQFSRLINVYFKCVISTPLDGKYNLLPFYHQGNGSFKHWKVTRHNTVILHREESLSTSLLIFHYLVCE